MDEKKQTLGRLIEKIGFAMLTTHGDQGLLRSRPMATSEIGYDGDLWFMTRKDSPKAGEIRRDSRVNLSYSAPSQDRYVSISGRAELIEDAEHAKELWSPALRTWFPKGPADPDLLLIRIHVEQAEYWDKLSNRLVPLVSPRAHGEKLGQVG